MNLEDVCWLDSLFEQMMMKAQKVETKEEILAVIRSNHVIIKEKKFDMAGGVLHNC